MLKLTSKPLQQLWVGLSALLWCFSVGNVMGQEAASPVNVPVATPRRGTIVSAKQYTGHLQPQAEMKVFANVAGKIVTLNATVGERVAKGDVLAESPSKEAVLAVRRAEAALSSAQSQFTTTEANAQARVESQLAIAQETLMAAQAQLEETTSLAEMRIRNQLIQAESAYQAAEAAHERAKVNTEQALERAKVELDKTNLDFERSKALHEKQHISDSDFESAEQRLKVARTRHEEAVASANQFKDGTTQLTVEKAKAELAVARKVVESRGWERDIASAESKVNQAQATLSTAQKLVAAKSWEHEIEIARAAVRQAEEQLKLAQEQVDAATIASPIDGVVATRHLSVGDYAPSAAFPSGKPVFTVVAVDVLKAVWNMPVRDAHRINNGELALISTDAGIQNIVGTIAFISPTVNREDNTVLVHATVPNAAGARADDSGLKPGTAITVSIKTGARKNVQLLPLHSVLHIQNGSGMLFTVEGNVASRKEVTVGAVYGGEIEVTSRLAEGTLVIVDKQHRLQDGTQVSIVRD